MMMMRFQSTLLFLVTATAVVFLDSGLVSASKGRIPFLMQRKLVVPSTLSATSAAAASDGSLSKVTTSLRGGAGPIDPELAIKAMTIAAIGQGFWSKEAPEHCLEFYGTEDTGLYAQVCSRILGGGIFAIGVILLCLFTFDTSVHDALGWATVVWIAEHVRSLLNGWDAELQGSEPIGRYFWLIVSTFVAHACFTGADYADLAIKLSTALFALNCIIAIFNPVAAAAIYKCKNLSHDGCILTRGYGFENLAYCTLVIALVSGVDKQQAVGYLSLPVIPHMIYSIYETNKLQRNVAISWSFFIWLLYHIASFITLAFPGSSPVESVTK